VIKLKDEVIVLLVLGGVASLATVGCVSLYYGIDGQVMAAVVGGISSIITGVVAYMAGKKKANKG